MFGRVPNAADLVEHVAVVRDEHQLGRALFAPVRSPEAQVERRCPWSEQLGQHLLHRLELGVAVRVGLDDLRIDPERDVVDEDPLVDEREIDAPLELRR